MKRFLIVSMLFLCCPWFVRAADPPVFISEVAWAGSSLSTADEWLEVCGPPGADLSGWRIEGASANPLILANGSVIPSSGAFLISNYGSDDPKTSLAVPPNLVTTAVALSNSSLFLKLHDANGALADEAGTAGTAPLAGTSGSAKASMERLWPLALGGTPEAWAAASVSQGFDTGSAEFGTPGACQVTAEEEPAPEPEEPPPEPEEETPVPEEPMPAPTEETPPAEPAEAPPTESTTTTPVTQTPSEPEEPAPAETASNPPPASQAPNAQTQPTTTVRISEVYPAPSSGEKEWIELVNLSTIGEILDGWTVEDGKGTKTKLSGLIMPWARMVIESPKGTLNNDGDLVVLKDAEGRVIDGVAYGIWETVSHPRVGEINKGWSAIRPEFQDIFDVTTTATRGETNVLTKPILVEPAKPSATLPVGPDTAQEKEGETKTNAASAKTQAAASKPASAKTSASAALAAKPVVTASTKKTAVAKTTVAKKAPAKAPAPKYKGDAFEGMIAVPTGVYSKTKMYLLDEAGLREVRLSKSTLGFSSGQNIAFIAQEKKEDGSTFLLANPNSIRLLDSSASTTFATINRWPAEPGAYRFEAEVVSMKAGSLEVRLDGKEGDLLLPSAVPGLKPRDRVGIEGFVAPGARARVVLASADAIRLVAAAPGAPAVGGSASNGQGSGGHLPWPLAAGLTAIIAVFGIAAYLRSERLKRLALVAQPLEEDMA